MATLEDFLPYVEPHALGAPIPGLLHEIRSTLIDFCERTRCWKEVLPVKLRAGRQAYEMPDVWEDDGEVFLIEQIAIGTDALVPVTTLNLDLTGDPVEYTQVLPTGFIVNPTPSQASTAIVQAFAKPTRTANSVPDFLFSRYADTISHGAIARLLETRNNPYGDMTSAPYHRAQYEAGLHSHAALASKNFTRAPLRAAPDF
jgi:hypothetical protein